jgi:hypothetical protein
VRSLSSEVVAAINAGTVSIVQLIFMDLSEPIYLNSSSWNLEWDGQTWLGAAGVGRIDEITDGPGEVKGLSFQLSGVRSQDLALALEEPLQGKSVVIYTAILDPNTFTVLDAFVEWSGRLDTMSTSEQGQNATITATAEHIGIDLLRPRVYRYTHQDQQRLFEGDLGLQFVVDQSDKPIVWPAASFFRR